MGYVGPFKSPENMPPSNCQGECVADYGACSGQYAQTSLCCSEDFACVEKGAFYAECVPATSIMTMVATGWTGRVMSC